MKAEGVAAVLETMRAVQRFLIMKLPLADREELDDIIKKLLVEMEVTTKDWKSTLDPQKYRDEMSFEFQEILNLPKTTDKPDDHK